MKRIIIVDDDMNFASSIAESLVEHDSQLSITVADSAEEAVRQMENLPVSVMVTDIKLPNKDGLSLAGTVKDRWPDTVIIIMSAYGAEDVIKSAFTAGAMFYIEKPFNAENLGNMIKMAGLKRHAKPVMNGDNVVKLQVHKQPGTL